MNINRILVLVIVLVIAGAAVVIQQYESIKQVELLEQAAFKKVKALEVRQAQLKVLAAEKMKQEAIEAARKANAEAQMAEQIATEEIRKAIREAQQKAPELKAVEAQQAVSQE